jgi:hypothetical protein
MLSIYMQKSCSYHTDLSYNMNKQDQWITGADLYNAGLFMKCVIFVGLISCLRSGKKQHYGNSQQI